ncbi:MAG: PEP-CTERM sorting domain-containing protein [Planctomycetota bacterium]
MKKVLAALVVVCAAQAANARPIINDTAGDVFTGAGGGILDILSLEVSDDTSSLSFKFTLAGDVVATDWGKYMVMIDTVAGGDNGGNGWARPISWGQPGIGAGADYWIGSWVDSGNGAENYNYSGSWALQDATYSNGLISIAKAGSTVTISTALSRLGLGENQSFCFDAFTSGGGGTDGAIDSLGDPGVHVGDWGQQSNAFPVCYTTTPEPGSLGLLCIGGLALIRRRR